MVVYLPIAFIKDWLCSVLKRHSSKRGRISEIIIKSPSGLDSSLKISGMQKILEMESQAPLTKKDSELEHSAQEEEKPLIVKLDDVEVRKENRTFTTREIAVRACYLAPLWFVTEVRFYYYCSIYFVAYVVSIYVFGWCNELLIMIPSCLFFPCQICKTEYDVSQKINICLFIFIYFYLLIYLNNFCLILHWNNKILYQISA